MRGSTTSVKVVPRGAYVLALKARGELVEGSINDLRGELYATRKATQHVIDCLWELDKIPTINQLHQMFYKILRSQGFRAHQCKQIYKYARAIIVGILNQFKENFYQETLEWILNLLSNEDKRKLRKQAKKIAREMADIVYRDILSNPIVRNANVKKPELKKLTTRLDKYDTRVDLEKQLAIVKLRNREFKIKLLHRKNYIEKFKDRKWYEATVSIDRSGRIWIAILFRWNYNPYKPMRIISIDVNLRKIVTYNGRSARRIDTRFIEALSLKIHAEKLQKKYPKRWRYNERILSRVRNLHRRSKYIVIDWSRKFAKYIVLKAKRRRSAIVLEDLEKLWFNVSKKSSSLADKLSRFAYRKLQLAIITKAIEYNIPILYVNPKDTSTTCPRCGNKLSYNHRLAVCSRCGFMADRDVVGAMNIYLRALRRMWESQGSPPNAPAMKDETRQSGRTKDEPMTVHIHSYKII